MRTKRDELDIFAVKLNILWNVDILLIDMLGRFSLQYIFSKLESELYDGNHLRLNITLGAYILPFLGYLELT